MQQYGSQTGNQPGGEGHGGPKRKVLKMPEKRVKEKLYSLYDLQGLLESEDPLNYLRLAAHQAHVRLSEHHAKACRKKGQHLYDKMKFQEAIHYLDRSIELDPWRKEAYWARWVIRDIYADYEGVISDLDMVIRIVPDFASAYYFRASRRDWFYDDVQGAVADYSKAIELAPSNSAAHAHRALLKRDRLNDYKGAIEDYNNAIALNKDCCIHHICAPEYFYQRGLAKVYLGEYEGGLYDLLQARKLGSRASAEALERYFKDDPVFRAVTS